MKVPCLWLLCIYAAVTAALPFQIVLTSDTPSIRFKNTPRPLSQHVSPPNDDAPRRESEQSNRPTFQQYVKHIRTKTQTTETVDAATNSPWTQGQILSPSEPKENPETRSRSRYGAFLGRLGKLLSNKHACDEDLSALVQASHLNFNLTTSTITYARTVDVLDVIDRHGPECLALFIFVLVPIAYFMLELLELVLKYWVRERYPHRGRDRVRLLGHERQLRAWNNRQREWTLEGEKHWWHLRRARN
ncbi:hypothetical protein N7462_001743 [Penicillium macrosclerotiorum]|uniref:uncharacterized protein n=1 Tax=Penicillium macrosclerotiorum TaxID=303699 RepID=UPI002548036A|nr:uncharacterized protein N7462_001743 [Penicillium macrosclerotiorum]KAJ5692320.1 hypothetical protein N7462_001743 [Penicillium macrosclerotiorum]